MMKIIWLVEQHMAFEAHQTELLRIQEFLRFGL